MPSPILLKLPASLVPSLGRSRTEYKLPCPVCNHNKTPRPPPAGHSLPTDIVSEYGPQFTSIYWKEFCGLLGTSVSLSSGFHPQSEGQIERKNQDNETTPCCLTFHNPASWSEQILWAENVHNTLSSSSTGLSPFK